MLEIRVYDYEDKKELSRFQMKGSINKESPFTILREIECKQKDKDMLGIGRLGMASMGISRLYTKGNMVTSMDSDSTCVLTGKNSFEISARAQREDTTPEVLKIDNEETGIRIGIIMYEPGWMLATGVQSSNIFGVVQDNTWLKSIGRRKYYYGSKSSARKFPTVKDVLEYVDKNRYAFEYAVKAHAFHWTLDPSCEMFEKDFRASLTGRKKEEHERHMGDLMAILGEINSVGKIDTLDRQSIPEEATEETITAEVEYRRKKYNLAGQVKKLMMSEFGGMLYELDEDAKRAVKEAEETGLRPWHVIKTSYGEIGTVYAVLYVSNDVAEWPMERGNASGYCIAFCWNATYQFEEMGEVRILATNGGLVRTA